MKFIHTVRDSIFSKSFYSNIVQGNTPIGYGFLAKLQILVALFITILFSIHLAQQLPAIQKFAESVLPDGAEIILADGKLQTNVNPIIVPITDIADLSDSRDQSLPANVLVLDVTASTTAEDLIKRGTYFLVTSEGVVSGKANKKITIDYFKDIKDFNITVDKSFLLNKVAWLKRIAKFIPFFAFIVMWAGLYIVSLFSALLTAVFVWILFKIMKIGKGFREAFAVGMYSRVFAIVIGIFAMVAPILSSGLINVLIQALFIIFMIKPARLKTII